jgi:hypothetical protein
MFISFTLVTSGTNPFSDKRKPYKIWKFFADFLWANINSQLFSFSSHKLQRSTCALLFLSSFLLTHTNITILYLIDFLDSSLIFLKSTSCNQVIIPTHACLLLKILHWLGSNLPFKKDMFRDKVTLHLQLLQITWVKKICVHTFFFFWDDCLKCKRP